jgi:hypothetical protein
VLALHRAWFTEVAERRYHRIDGGTRSSVDRTAAD